MKCKDCQFKMCSARRDGGSCASTISGDYDEGIWFKTDDKSI